VILNEITSVVTQQALYLYPYPVSSFDQNNNHIIITIKIKKIQQIGPARMNNKNPNLHRNILMLYAGTQDEYFPRFIHSSMIHVKGIVKSEAKFKANKKS